MNNALRKSPSSTSFNPKLSDGKKKLSKTKGDRNYRDDLRQKKKHVLRATRVMPSINYVPAANTSLIPLIHTENQLIHIPVNTRTHDLTKSGANKHDYRCSIYTRRRHLII